MEYNGYETIIGGACAAVVVDGGGIQNRFFFT